jgi:hypothetical protein
MLDRDLGNRKAGNGDTRGNQHGSEQKILPETTLVIVRGHVSPPVTPTQRLVRGKVPRSGAFKNRG